MMKEKLIELKLTDITVGKRHRPIRDSEDADMLGLAESIVKDGLIQPITVCGDNRLVTGARRLFAHRLNKETTIKAIWKPYDGVQAERAEIIENLERKQLTALEEAQQTLRLQELYLSEHPETKQNKAGGHGKHKSASDKMSFAEETARRFGKSRKTIERTIKLAKDLDAEVQEDLKGTPIEDKKSELTKLAKMPVRKQKAVVKKIKSGEITRVSEKPKPKPPKSESESDKRDRVVTKATIEIRRTINQEIKNIGDHLPEATKTSILALTKQIVNSLSNLKI